MEMYATRAEFSGVGDMTDDNVDDLMERLDGFHASLSGTPIDRLGIRLSLPAESVDQAARAALAVCGTAVLSVFPDARPVGLEVLTESDFFVREGWGDVPPLMSSGEAAEFLGVTPQRIRQMIDEGKLQSARRIGERSYALAQGEIDKQVRSSVEVDLVPREAVEDEAFKSVVLGVSSAPNDEDWQAVLSPIYEALRTVGLLPAYNAAMAAERGDPHDAAKAAAWHAAEERALEEMSLRGYEVSGVRFMAKRLRP